MAVLIISCLVFFGALLVIAEIIFIPGTTIIGLLGIVFTALGVIYAYQVLDSSAAHLVFGGAVIVNAILLVVGFRSGVWNRFSLKETSSGRTFDNRLDGLEVGQEGVTRSDCKPFGKALFGEKMYEVKSENGFISTNTRITISRIENNKIIIKQ